MNANTIKAAAKPLGMLAVRCAALQTFCRALRESAVDDKSDAQHRPPASRGSARPTSSSIMGFEFEKEAVGENRRSRTVARDPPDWSVRLGCARRDPRREGHAVVPRVSRSELAGRGGGRRPMHARVGERPDEPRGPSRSAPRREAQIHGAPAAGRSGSRRAAVRGPCLAAVDDDERARAVAPRVVEAAAARPVDGLRRPEHAPRGCAAARARPAPRGPRRRPSRAPRRGGSAARPRRRRRRRARRDRPASRAPGQRLPDGRVMADRGAGGRRWRRVRGAAQGAKPQSAARRCRARAGSSAGGAGLPASAPSGQAALVKFGISNW